MIIAEKIKHSNLGEYMETLWAMLYFDKNLPGQNLSMETRFILILFK